MCKTSLLQNILHPSLPLMSKTNLGQKSSPPLLPVIYKTNLRQNIFLPSLPLMCKTKQNFIFMKRIEIPRAESCDVTIINIKSWPYYGYMAMPFSVTSVSYFDTNNADRTKYMTLVTRIQLVVTERIYKMNCNL